MAEKNRTKKKFKEPSIRHLVDKDFRISEKEKYIGGPATTFIRQTKAWYRGDTCNFRPNKNELQAGNVDRHVLYGWLPKEPFIDKKSNVVTVGSCFAREVAAYLYENGYRSVEPPGKNTAEYVASGSNHTFAMRQLFEWAWQGKEPKNETWYKKSVEKLQRNNRARQETAEYFSNADVFVLTLGLSEVWQDKRTNDVFWRAIPEDEFDPTIHEFRVSTVEENRDNLNAILDLIEQYAPQAKVIFTLSPVPLKATFRPVSNITANQVSKAILRVAVDDVVRERDVHNNDKLYYWPSYEIVREYESDPYQRDNIHITKDAVLRIMKSFEKYYLVRKK
jgi:hypothetical protein